MNLARARHAVLILLAGCAACVQAGDADRRAGVAAAWNEVTTLVGDAACSDDNQCRTQPVGSKACGGPGAFIAWSMQRTDGNVLAAAAARHAEQAKLADQQSGRMSNCSIVPDPGARCQAGHCVLRPRNQGS